MGGWGRTSSAASAVDGAGGRGWLGYSGGAGCLLVLSLGTADFYYPSSKDSGLEFAAPSGV